MRVYIQWAKADPGDYVSLDLTRIQQVRSLPKKPVPTGQPTLDNNEGWLADVLVQGVSFSGVDHLSCAFPSDGSFEVMAWNDDPEDYPDGPEGYVWRFFNPTLDPRYGEVNTRQLLTVYTSVPALIANWTGQSTSGGPVTVRPWSEFVIPPSNVTFHGVWQTDPLFELHRQRRTPHSWREWIA